jgi:glutaminyl-peptide cyclotransferase
MKSFFLLSLILLISFSACQTKPVRKPVTNIEVINANKLIKHGEIITVKINTKLFNSSLKQTSVFINNELVHTSNQGSFHFNISTSELLPGKYTIKSISTNQNDIEGISNKTISIISDIIPENLKYKVVGVLEHNTSYFTQGFEFFNNILYESTGDYGTSHIFAYYPQTGKIINSLKIDDQYFGEGITILNEKIYQLTYKSKIGFIYDLNNFKKLGEFSFSSAEGWGLTNDGKYLIMSDGTSKITYLDPNDFSIVKSLEISNHQGWVDLINELEYVDGFIYANIWTKDLIIKFDASNGKIVSQINMKGLHSNLSTNRIDVLNGIAWNKDDKTFYLTGKFWPKIYRVQFSPEH